MSVARPLSSNQWKITQYYGMKWNESKKKPAPAPYTTNIITNRNVYRILFYLVRTYEQLNKTYSDNTVNFAIKLGSKNVANILIELVLTNATCLWIHHHKSTTYSKWIIYCHGEWENLHTAQMGPALNALYDGRRDKKQNNGIIIIIVKISEHIKITEWCIYIVFTATLKMIPRWISVLMC